MTKHTIIFLILLFLTDAILGQKNYIPINDSDIKGFIDWKIANPKTNDNHELNISYYSPKISHIAKSEIISFWQDIIKNKTDFGFDSTDLEYAVKQLESSKNDTVWDAKSIPLKKLPKKIKKDENIVFWKFSKPIFNKTKTFGTALTNINCYENYCHSNLIAVYKKTGLNKWIKVKKLMEISY